MCEIPLTFKARKILGTAISVFHAVLILTQICLILIAIHILVSLKKYTILLEGRYSNGLPWMLIATAIIMIINHVVGGYITFSAVDWMKLEDFKLPLTMYMVGQLVVCWFVLAASITASADKRVLVKAFHEGVTSVIAQYEYGGKMKVEIDTFQLNYKCCGAANYTNWFKMKWIDQEFLDPAV